MYTVGERSEQVSAFTQPAPVEYVQTVDGRFIPVTPAAQPVGYTNALQPAAAAPALQPAVIQRPVVSERPAPRQTVYRTAQQPVRERVVVREESEPARSWKKTALIIGGSTAAGAGTGGIIGGKKGALIGAAIGGGAASIYEATKR
jgi:hypothetical protein